MSGLSDFFSGLEDPRAANRVYRLGDLVVLMLAASLCGAQTASDVALFAELRKQTLNRLVPYARAPSHDTFSRLLRLVDAKAFAVLFASFATAFAKALSGQGLKPQQKVVALAGKALRRAYETGLVNAPPLVVSAFATEAKLCLAASAAGADNEVEAALKVVELLDLSGQIVTADALHCHHRMAEAVIARKGDYVLALKGNRHEWLKAAADHFRPGSFRPEAIRSAKDTSFAHDRFEWRKASVVAAATPFTAGHKSFVRVVSKRSHEDPVTRYFIASRHFTPKQALAIVREHWQIENNLHWILDVHLGEDLSRARKDNAPANTALLKRFARNILSFADLPKVPISHRIKKCMWDDNYLIHALSHLR